MLYKRNICEALQRQRNVAQGGAGVWVGESSLPTDDKDVEHPLPTAYIQIIYEEV